MVVIDDLQDMPDVNVINREQLDGAVYKTSGVPAK